jgi:hypothetical protein
LLRTRIPRDRVRGCEKNIEPETHNNTTQRMS